MLANRVPQGLGENEKEKQKYLCTRMSNITYFLKDPQELFLASNT
jgi:hypothetical protein